MDMQGVFPGRLYDALPAWIIFTSRFVIPCMFAGVDDRRRLRQALIVAAFRGNGHDGVIAEHFLLCSDTEDVPGFVDNSLVVYEFEQAMAVIDIAAMETRPMGGTNGSGGNV